METWAVEEELRAAFAQTDDALRPQPLAVNGLELAVHYAPADFHADG